MALRMPPDAPPLIGDVRFDFELDAGEGGLTPTLVLGVGEKVTRIPLHAVPGRRIVAVVTVPPGTSAVELDPGTNVSFRVGTLRVTELSLVAALAEHAAPALARLIRDPAQMWVMGGRAMRLLRYRGARGVLERLRQGTRRHTEEAGYQRWSERYARLTPVQREHLQRRMATLRRRPVVSVLVALHDKSELAVKRTVESVQTQLYPHWELWLEEELESGSRSASRSNDDVRIRSRPSATALDEARGQLVIRLMAGDALAEHALLAVADAVDRDASLALIYGDEDQESEAGQSSYPDFKPDWSPELLRSLNYVGRAAVFRTERVRDLGGWRAGLGGVPQHDLLLRYTAGLEPSRVCHLPFVLLHGRPEQPMSAEEGEAGVSAVQGALDAASVRARVVAGSRPRTYHVRYSLPERAPRVTIIIPTRDRHDLLRRCIDSLGDRTGYQPLELLVVDNDSRERRTVEFLRHLEQTGAARVLRYPHPFNYSEMNNRAAAQASGELLCLLNNDIEAIAPGWLTEMVGLALQPGVGAVGAKLCYPNGTVQHVGAVAGLFGVGAHPYVREPANADGYKLQLQTTREVASVTAACLVIRRDRYLEVGGLDAVQLQVGFNDFDLCFKLLRAGYRNVVTPHAVLQHRESVSRGHDERSRDRKRYLAEEAVMRERWQALIDHDPYYSPNLSLDSNVPRPAWPPRMTWSWMEAG